MPQVKKISVKTVYGQIIPSKLIAAPGQRLHVMTVVGIATSTKEVMSDMGESTALMGDFEGVNPETGEALRASVLYLPNIALTALQVAMATSSNGAVSFGMDIWAEYVAEKPGFRGGAIYEYTFAPIVPPTEETDPILKLKASYAKQRLALAAPGDETKPAETSKPATKSARK